MNNVNPSFETIRPRLLGLSYRILGSLADAEDAVQDTWLKWAGTDPGGIENPEHWLITVCTRRCLDLLRSPQRSRVDYVGTWLPEPIHTPSESGPELDLELASSLSTAFLLALERLSPKERAAYLLREVFGLSYDEVAGTLAVRESTCRKLVSRAKVNIREARTGHAPPPERQQSFMDAFRMAVMDGDIKDLSRLLAREVVLTADGGGKVPAALEPLRGLEAVCNFIVKRLSSYWAQYRWTRTSINGSSGFLLENDCGISAVVNFDFDAQGKAKDIFILRNPDKIARLTDVQIV